MPFYAGKNSYVELDGGRRLPMAEWGLSVRAERADVSDVSQKSLRSLPGLVSAEVSLSGPYDWDLRYGVADDVSVGLGLGSAVFLTLAARVESVRVTSHLRSAAQVELTAVVTQDLFDADGLTIVVF